MSNFWSSYIAFIVTINILGCALLLFFTRRNPLKNKTDDETTGHVFDGIQELNKPLPRWWIYVFWLTIIFSVIYLLLYPGYGSFHGGLGWSSVQQLQQEQQEANAKYGPIYAKYGQMSVEELSKNPKALAIGERLFANNCAMCHGSDAKGGRGFPNLVDAYWLHGGTPADIEETIANGRDGAMPPLGQALGQEKVKELVAYIMSLSGRSTDQYLINKGHETFLQACAACHGTDAKGNQAIGSANLTSNAWLYGGDAETLTETITNGRNGHMPAHLKLLGKDKVHILAAYVYSLSHKQ